MRNDRNLYVVRAWIVGLIAMNCISFSKAIAYSGSWQADSPLNTGRYQFAGGVIDGKIYVFGGNNSDDDDLKTTEMFAPATDKWIYKASNEHNSGCGVEEVSGAVVNGKFYVFGAYSHGIINFVEEYDPATNIWTTKSPMPTTRADGVAVVYNNKIYVFGGGGLEDDTLSDVVEVYDPSTDTWQPEPVTHMPKVVDRPIVAVVGNKAYVFCGRSEEPEKQTLSDVSAYDFTTNTWTTTGLLSVPHPREIGSCPPPVVNGKIYLIGGGKWTQGNVELVEDVDIYDPASNTWQTGIPLPIPTGSYVSAVVNDKIYVIGGGNVSGPTAAVWNIDSVSVQTTSPDEETTQQLVTEIYVATFGRAPANAGLNYWADSVDTGSFTIEQVAQSFFDQPETQAKFPEDSSNSEFITTIYYNVLNRAPADTGLAYWVAALDSGTMRRDQAIMAIINGAKAATGGSDDAAMLAKKTEIGVYFANSEIGTSFTADENFMDWATNIISFAASDDFNLEDAEEYISNIIAPCAYTGSYSGIFSGDDHGTWSVTVSNNCEVSGSGYSDQDGAFILVGNITDSGSIVMVAGDVTTGATFSGNINNFGGVSGTWFNSHWQMSGTFDGKLK